VQPSTATASIKGITPLYMPRRQVTPDCTATLPLTARAIQQSIIAAAKYCKRQVPDHGNAWTANLTAGISVLDESTLRVGHVTWGISEWSATFDVTILEPAITEEVLRDMLDLAGQIIGVGRCRPEKGGPYGRFKIEDIVWQDNRSLAA
jgi:hypothetical protein